MHFEVLSKVTEIQPVEIIVKREITLKTLIFRPLTEAEIQEKRRLVKERLAAKNAGNQSTDVACTVTEESTDVSADKADTIGSYTCTCIWFLSST